MQNSQHLLTAEWNPAVTSDGTNRAASSRRIRVPYGNSPLIKMPHLEDPFRVSWFFSYELIYKTENESSLLLRFTSPLLL